MPRRGRSARRARSGMVEARREIKRIWRETGMGIEFPLDCKLNDAEKRMLKVVLDEDDSPCDECTWKDSCGGPEEIRKSLESIITDSEGRCPACSEEIGSKVFARALGGTFSKCCSGEDFSFELGDTRPVEDILS